MSDAQGNQRNEVHTFLLRTAELLHQYGTPSYRLERVMAKVANVLGVKGTFLYTPTALVVALDEGDDEATYLRRVDAGEVDISKLIAFDEILEELEIKTISVREAKLRIDSAAAADSPFGLAVVLAASAVACGGIAVIFGGGLADTFVAALFGAIIAFVSHFGHSRHIAQGWSESVLAFAVAIVAVAVARWLPVDSRLITLAALILPIPGLALTVALTELALGHLSSGSARLAGASVKLLTLVLGVAIAWRLTQPWQLPNPPIIVPLPVWCLWIAVAVTPVAFAIVFKAPRSQWFLISVVVIAGFVASRFGNLASPETGAFVGALVVGCSSNLYARVLNRPAMVTQTPGLLILVPGSIGYRSLTAMVESDTLKGVELAFTMTIIGIALAGGLLLANQILPPKRIL